VKQSEAARIVAMLQGAWTQRQLPESTAEVYALTLADLDYELAKAAVVKLIQTSKWLPTVAEIRDTAVRSRVSLPSPEEAWGVVHRAISKHGSYRTPTFDCEEIDGAVGDIGWRAICLTENIASERARFIDAFKARSSRRIQAEATGKYVPREKLLPPAEHEREIGDTRVLVETGYPTGNLVKQLKAPESRGVLADVLKQLTGRIEVIDAGEDDAA
jgi:hypothetical protein